MSDEPEFKMTKITAMHGISATGDTLLIGVQVNNQPFGWGECMGLFNDPSIVYNMGTATSTIHKVVAPVLQERPFTNIRDLCQRLEGLTEPITKLEPEVVQPKPAGTSRRDMLTGFFKGEAADNAPKVNRFEGKRPLPPPLQFGICQAILNGFAIARKQSPAQLLAADYELTATPKSARLHVEVTDENMAAVNSILKEHVKSLGYTIKTNNPEKTLGTKGEKLESLIQQLTDWIVTKPTNRELTIHLNVSGALADMFGTNVNQMKRLLNALELAGAPYPISLENLGIEMERVKPTLLYHKLQSLVRYKEIPIKLWVGHPHYSLNAIEQFIKWGKIGGVHLAISQTGNLEQTMKLIAACQAKGIQVMVSGGQTALGVKTAVSIATATNANLIAGPPEMIYNTLQQSKFV